MSAMNYIEIMNSTVNETLIRKCKRELKKMGYNAVFDHYVQDSEVARVLGGKWVLV